MRKLTFIFLIIILLASVAGLVFWGFKKLPQSSTSFSKNSEPVNEELESSGVVDSALIKLDNQGPAPDFIGATDWINSEPITIASLKDKVVLVHFWTYSSIQSIEMSEWLTKLYSRYSEQGLQIIGVHTPQYNFERVYAGVDSAVKRYNLPYPVALDNNYKLWQSYQNTFWPTTYVLDKEGNIVFASIGEDQQKQIEEVVKSILAIEGGVEAEQSPTKIAIPDLHLGLIKLSKFGGTEKPNSQEQIFVLPKKLAKDKFALEGKWSFSQESAMHTQGFGKLRLNFKAQKVSMVAKSTFPMTVKIYVDGALHKAIVIDPVDVYELFNSAENQSRTIELEIPRGGLEIFSFSFE